MAERQYICDSLPLPPSLAAGTASVPTVPVRTVCDALWRDHFRRIRLHPPSGFQHLTIGLARCREALNALADPGAGRSLLPCFTHKEGEARHPRSHST